MPQAYVGYNSIGANWEPMGTHTVYAKKVTLDQDGLLASISAHLRHPASGLDDQVHNLAVALYTDNAGVPGVLIGGVSNAQLSLLFDAIPGDGGDDTGRWFHVPVGAWLEAGDYWIAVQQHRSPATMELAYDDSGSDPIYSAGGAWFADWGWYTPADSGKQYSLRATVIR